MGGAKSRQLVGSGSSSVIMRVCRSPTKSRNFVGPSSLSRK